MDTKSMTVLCVGVVCFAGETRLILQRRIWHSGFSWIVGKGWKGGTWVYFSHNVLKLDWTKTWGCSVVTNTQVLWILKVWILNTNIPHTVYRKKKACFVLLPCWSLFTLIWKGRSVLSCKAWDFLHCQQIWLMLWGLTKMICLLGRSYCCQIFSFITQLHGNWYIIALEVEGFKELVTNSFSLSDHILTLYWLLIRMFNTVCSFYSIEGLKLLLCDSP